MDLNVKLSQDEGELLDDPSQYRWMIEKLLYLTTTKSDLSYSMNRLSQFLAKPRVPHSQEIHHVLQYVKSTIGQSLFFSCTSSTKFKGFVDSGQVSCLDTRKSIGGFCVLIGDSLVSQKSKKQHMVSKSSTKA